MAGHVNLAILTLLHKRFEITIHGWPEHMFLSSHLDPSEISLMIRMKDLFYSILQDLRDHHSASQVTVMEHQELVLILTHQ